jgi:ribosomal-protein-alanine N-acetyltransferase
MVPADLQRVLEIAQSLKEAPHWPRAAYLAALDPQGSPRRIALVAETDGVLAGFAIATLLPPQAELEMIAVAAERQQRGVARQIFSALAGKFEVARITEVILEVRASNCPALGLYRSLGFQQSGCRPRYYADPIEDALLMMLRVE